MNYRQGNNMYIANQVKGEKLTLNYPEKIREIQRNFVV